MNVLAARGSSFHIKAQPPFFLERVICLNFVHSFVLLFVQIHVFFSINYNISLIERELLQWCCIYETAKWRSTVCHSAYKYTGFPFQTFFIDLNPIFFHILAREIDVLCP